jgi:hypothetical protein
VEAGRRIDLDDEELVGLLREAAERGQAPTGRRQCADATVDSGRCARRGIPTRGRGVIGARGFNESGRAQHQCAAVFPDRSSGDRRLRDQARQDIG